MQQNKKIFAVDMDGTLLRSDETISKANIDAITKYVSLGNYFVITTGRPFFRIKKHLETLNLLPSNNPVIIFNGGMIMNLLNNEVYDEHYLKDEEVKNLIAFSKKVNLHILLYIEEEIYSDCVPDTQEYFNKVKEIKILGDKEHFNFHGNVHKVLLFGSEAEIDSLEKRPELSSMREGLTIVRTLKYCMEFYTKGISKGAALLKISEILNVPLENTYAIGDEQNDYDLILSAGTGITLENGCTALKQIADFIVRSNNDDGVADAINNIILKDKEK